MNLPWCIGLRPSYAVAAYASFSPEGSSRLSGCFFTVWIHTRVYPYCFFCLEADNYSINSANRRNEMQINSITSIMQKAALANNKRLISLSMTGAEIRMAEKAVERGLMTKYSMNFPGFKFVPVYQAI